MVQVEGEEIASNARRGTAIRFYRLLSNCNPRGLTMSTSSDSRCMLFLARLTISYWKTSIRVLVRLTMSVGPLRYSRPPKKLNAIRIALRGNIKRSLVMRDGLTPRSYAARQGAHTEKDMPWPLLGNEQRWDCVFISLASLIWNLGCSHWHVYLVWSVF